MVKTLIVEDSILFRKLLKEALNSRFPTMEIFEAGDGLEGQQIIDCIPIDLIFMDIKLPDENGLELTKKIKGKHPGIVIIILTSYDTPEYREAAEEAEADYFLVKGSSTKNGIIGLVESILSSQ